MRYVEYLLNGKLIEYQEMHRIAKQSNDNAETQVCIRIISELEYVLGILKHNETYQKY